MASGGLLGNCRQEFKKDKRRLIFFFNNKLIQTQKEIWQKRSLPQHYKHGFVSVRWYQIHGSTWCTYSRVFIHRWDLKPVFSLQQHLSQSLSAVCRATAQSLSDGGSGMTQLWGTEEPSGWSAPTINPSQSLLKTD